MTNPRNHKFQSLVLKTFKIYCFKKKLRLKIYVYMMLHNLRLHNSLYNVTYAVCYLHIKQIAISQERRAIWKTIDGVPLFQEFFQIRQT